MAILFIPAIAISFTLLTEVTWFLRVAPSQREMTWELGNKGIFLKDSAGNGVQLPWSQVKKFSHRKTGFLIDIRPAGSRWIPMRAFREEQVEGVKDLAERMTHSG
ncbi:MAG: YcxB family protein [Pseudomonadota bacterium]